MEDEAWRAGSDVPAYEHGEPLVPNKTTIAAMLEARAGGVARFSDVEAFMADLENDE